MNWMYAHFHCAGFKEFLFKPQSLQYFMIRTWFNTNTVLCHNFVLSWNALRLIVNTEDQWSDTERLPYGAINLCFFYCNRCKGLSGSITFPGQLSFSVLNRVLRESFFTRYKMQAIGICHSQSVQSTQLTEIYSQLALCGTSCFPIC